MNSATKLFIISGLILISLGILIEFAHRFHIPLGKLPGDIFWKGRAGSFYFPITTGVVISVLASSTLYLWKSLK